jgi:SulP family sulfate permease
MLCRCAYALLLVYTTSSAKFAAFRLPMTEQFTPKFVTLLRRGISREQLRKDLLSGLIVGIVALPLAIAFAIASGVSPEKGIITAIIAGIAISALGGSRVQIGGPTGAFIVIVYAVVRQYGVDGLIVATFIAGFIIAAMGLLRLGNLLRFIPYPLIVGFTTGIAVIILSSQVNDFFGMSLTDVPANFIGKCVLYSRHMGDINYQALAIAMLTVVVTLWFRKITRKVPGSIVAIVLSTAVVYFFELPVDTIETRFGDIPSTFSAPHIPDIDFETFKGLLQPALAIALLGAIESLLSAVVADGMIGGRHRSNMELVAQGAANVLSAIFGGIPATGAIARTATNVKNGGRTPIAGITHALVLLLIMLLLAPYAKLIPMACLSGILVVVAYHMSEWRHFVSMLRTNRLDVLVLVTTFLLTVFFDLVIAIEIGIVLASLTFMKRMSEAVSVQSVKDVADEAEGSDELFEEELPSIPEGVVLYRINGALFFGATQKFQDTISDLHEIPKVVILRMRYVPFIDATGIHRLKQIVRNFKHQGVTTILSGVSRDVREELFSAGFYSVIGKENIHDSINASIERAKQLVEPAA